MPETNIVMDAQGNITRGVPGKMTELDVSQKGGHATGRTEHVRQKDGDKPTRRAPARQSKNMNLDQLIGRTPSAKVDKAGDKALVEEKPKRSRGGAKTLKPEVAPEPQPAPVPAAEPAPEPVPEPVPSQEEDKEMWTGAASQAHDSGLPYLTIEHNGIKLHFTQEDINTARGTSPDKRDDMEQAIVDYGDRVERERKEAEERAAAIAAAAQMPNEADRAPVEEPKPESASQPIGGFATQPDNSQSAGQSSRTLNLGSSAPVPTKEPEEAPEPEVPVQTVAVSLGAETLGSEPLRRVSVRDICTALELELQALRDSLQLCGKGASLGIHSGLFLYYVSNYEGDPTYLFGYGANIAYVRIRDGVLSDCNNRFGIDEVCAWVNGMTWVIRRTDT